MALKRISLLGAMLLAAFSAGAADTSPSIHHAMHVVLQPENGSLEVEDVLTLPAQASPQEYQIRLHAGLAPRAEGAGVTLGAVPGPAADETETFRLKIPANQARVTLRYSGKISHPLEESFAAFGREERATRGFISTSGVYLDGLSGWYPSFDEMPVTFALEVTVPAAWNAISQGARTALTRDERGVTARWEEDHPQDEIHLVAGRYQEYSRAMGPVMGYVFLRTPDPALAERYLTAMTGYLSTYSQLLGPYPYAKFAAVENIWETGYGMPSFTLLGSSVLRLPFIVQGAFPHEILHNWWGNGVYVDYEGGNWSEGLTTYLADHMIQEQNGQGAGYRRTALQRYADYVAKHDDFSLAEFSGRHDEVSQAVGYDKGLMFFHMLRMKLGDERFIAGLRRFYHDNAFRRAGFAELRTAFEQETGEKLGPWFAQWLERAGGPALRVSDVRARKAGNEFVLKGTLEQTQNGPGYDMLVPLAVHMEGVGQARQFTLLMQDKRHPFELRIPARPEFVDVDPEFDIFRRLDSAELPPTLSQAYGASRLSIVLPSGAAPGIRKNYQALAQNWAADAPHISVSWDNEIEKLPVDRPVWLFGWENRFRPEAAGALANQNVTFTDKAVSVAGQALRRAQHSVVLAGRRADDTAQVLMWLGCEVPEAFTGLGRKLPHYGNYSYVAFDGKEPRNILKGQWEVKDSPLGVTLGRPGVGRAKLAPRPALTALFQGAAGASAPVSSTTGTR